MGKGKEGKGRGREGEGRKGRGRADPRPGFGKSKGGNHNHITSNSLANSRQAAYFKLHSTETALVYIHDHLVRAVASEKDIF